VAGLRPDGGRVLLRPRLGPPRLLPVGPYELAPEHRRAARSGRGRGRRGRRQLPRLSDERQAAIAESIEAAERDRKEAEQLAAENRQNLLEARTHAEDILTRARKSADAHEAKAREDAKTKGEEILAQARKDIESETRRAISEIRSEVADLTILATAKVTGKSLDGDDQRRLIEEALDGLDFSALSGEARR
jgi:F-type H+-transporting ATPase subunit b